ncbi:MAG TPA: UDP-glucose/GDP-mannose dehydrogenase family protein [Dehalococcoidia bacterium]|nr:UDP-glucose/GDP-mannose dehydrogenase family protein [Dehalococcoidia bacterium]
MKVSVIGLGYVGSVAAAGLAAGGHQVLGIDVNRSRVNAYREGQVPIYEPGLADIIRKMTADGDRLRFMHPDDVAEDLGDVVVIATGTPPSGKGEADLSQVISAMAWVVAKQKSRSVIIMKSTVPSGTGLRLIKTMLKGTPLQYVSNPEFLREGQAVWDWFHPDRIVIGGMEDEAIATVRGLYDGFDSPFVLTDVTSAETIKYAANAFLATKISFINEIALLCDRMGATIDDVALGISLDPRIGSSFLKAGVGYGGSCFPKDIDSLDHTALTNGHSCELLRSVIAINNRQRLLPLQALRECFGSLFGVRVGVLGLAFKPNTDDVRDAPAIDLVKHLAEEGALVRAFDPVSRANASRVVPESVELVDSLVESVADAQALVLMTEWPEIINADWADVARRVVPPRFLFDGRNVLDPAEMQRYGFRYQAVGRKARTRVELVGRA